MNAPLEADKESVEEGRFLQTALEELQEAAESLRHYRDVGRQLLESNEPVSGTTVALIRLGVNGATDRVGASPLRTISTEGLAPDALTITLESIDQNLKKIWEAIKATLKKFWDWAKSFVDKLLGSVESSEKDAKELLLALEDNSKQWGDVPDGADQPEYPYASLSNRDALILMVGGKIQSNWAKDIPPLFEQFIAWAADTAKQVFAKEKVLVEAWEKCARANGGDWEEFDALLIKTRNEYKSMYEKAPMLPGDSHVSVMEGPINTIGDIRGKVAHMGHGVDMNYGTQKLGAKIRKVSQGDMVSTLEAVIKLLDSEADVESLREDLKDFQSSYDRSLLAVTREHSRPAEEFGEGAGIKNWQQVQSRFQLVNGGELYSILFIYGSAFNLIRGYINTVQKISKMHLQ